MDFVLATCISYLQRGEKSIACTSTLNLHLHKINSKSQDKNRYDGRETCQLSNFSMSSIQPHENFDDHSTANRQNVKNFPSTPLEAR